MSSLGKAKHHVSGGDCHDARLDRHNSGKFLGISPATAQNHKIKNKNLELNTLLFLSEEALGMIDSILQPYCEDFLTRQSVIEDIDKIISNEKFK